jgi:hypothetical protein
MIEIEKCYICLENLDDVYRFPFDCNRSHLKCGCLNRYHTPCLNTWLSIQNKCPTCKKKINDIETINGGIIIDNNHNEINDDDFDLEVDDDNDIFYNPLAYFIGVYIVYFIVLFLMNHFLFYYLFLKRSNE